MLCSTVLTGTFHSLCRMKMNYIITIAKYTCVYIYLLCCLVCLGGTTSTVRSAFQCCPLFLYGKFIIKSVACKFIECVLSSPGARYFFQVHCIGTLSSYTS